jgi:hypothetical protein
MGALSNSVQSAVVSFTSWIRLSDNDGVSSVDDIPLHYVTIRLRPGTSLSEVAQLKAELGRVMERTVGVHVHSPLFSRVPLPIAHVSLDI